MGLDPHWEIIREAHRGFGGNINNFVLALEHVVDTEAWRSYVPPGEPRQEPATFAEFVWHVFAVKLDVIEGMLRKANSKSAAERVLAFMKADLPEVNQDGGARVKGQQSNNVTLVRGNEATYTLRRLKRDRPDLAEKVITGNMSANAAAIEAGFRRKTMTIPVGDPASVVRTLLRRYTREELLAALAATP